MAFLIPTTHPCGWRTQVCHRCSLWVAYEKFYFTTVINRAVQRACCTVYVSKIILWPCGNFEQLKEVRSTIIRCNQLVIMIWTIRYKPSQIRNIVRTLRLSESKILTTCLPLKLPLLFILVDNINSSIFFLMFFPFFFFFFRNLSKIKMFRNNYHNMLSNYSKRFRKWFLNYAPNSKLLLSLLFETSL